MGLTSWGKIQKASESPFLKLAVGDTQLRVISKEPHIYKVHFVGEGDDVERIICPEADCPICKLGQGPTLRYAVVVYERKTKAVKVLEQGKSIFGQLRDYAENAEWGDLRQYDVVIKRTGTGKNDTKYSVLVVPKKPLTKDEIAFIKQNMIALDKVYTPLSTDEIKEKIGGAQTKAESVEEEPNFGGDDDFPG